MLSRVYWIFVVVTLGYQTNLAIATDLPTQCGSLNFTDYGLIGSGASHLLFYPYDYFIAKEVCLKSKACIGPVLSSLAPVRFGELGKECVRSGSGKTDIVTPSGSVLDLYYCQSAVTKQNSSPLFISGLLPILGTACSYPSAAPNLVEPMIWMESQGWCFAQKPIHSVRSLLVMIPGDCSLSPTIESAINPVVSGTISSADIIIVMSRDASRGLSVGIDYSATSGAATVVSTGKPYWDSNLLDEAYIQSWLSGYATHVNANTALTKRGQPFGGVRGQLINAIRLIAAAGHRFVQTPFDQSAGTTWSDYDTQSYRDWLTRLSINGLPELQFRVELARQYAF